MQNEVGGGTSGADIAAWVFAQPLGIALLLLLVFALATERLVPGRTYRREQERADRLAEAFEILSKAGEKNAETSEKSLATSLLVHNLIQGIDQTLRRRD